MPEAQEVSEHLPIWAEFSVYEGGQAGHAERDANIATSARCRFRVANSSLEIGPRHVVRSGTH